MTLYLITHMLVTTVVTWIGLIVIIIANMFSWPYLIGCFILGNLIALPVTYVILKKSKGM